MLPGALMSIFGALWPCLEVDLRRSSEYLGLSCEYLGTSCEYLGGSCEYRGGSSEYLLGGAELPLLPLGRLPCRAIRADSEVWGTIDSARPGMSPVVTALAAWYSTKLSTAVARLRTGSA